jgi:hypothetical protein
MCAEIIDDIMAGSHLAIYFLPSLGESGFKGCPARIVPNYSEFRKRNQWNGSKHRLPPFEIAHLLVRFYHVASVIVNTNHRSM